MYLISNSSGSSETAIEIISTKDINKKIDILESEYRTPFLMHFEGFKYKEISEKLHIPIGTVKSRIFFARKKLMSLLPEYSYSTN
jgi:RNA polymerase sigma-70 factor (ECF subfamily)